MRARSELLHSSSFLCLLLSLDAVQACTTALVRVSFCLRLSFPHARQQGKERQKRQQQTAGCEDFRFKI